MKDDISQEINGNKIFSVYMYKCYKYDVTLLPKNLEMIFSQKKIYVKVIDMLDRILETIPTIICVFMELFMGIFIYCFLVKTKKENYKQDWNFTSSLIYIVKDILQ